MVAHARQTGTVSVLIDSPVWPWRGRRWSHLVSDVSYDELHAFVQTELGVPRRAFQGDHYDIPEDLYDVAVAAGAQPVGAPGAAQPAAGGGAAPDPEAARPLSRVSSAVMFAAARGRPLPGRLGVR